MFTVTDAEAAAIRAAFEQGGELAAAVELRRLFPAITDNTEARECARTIAAWKPLPVNVRHRLRRRGGAVLWICGICLAGLGSASAAAGIFDGVYTGERMVTKGPTSRCSAEADVTITIKSGTVRFAVGSNRSSIVIRFEPRPDGSFHRLSRGIDGSAGIVKGRIVGDVVDADVINARCEFHWHVTKVHRPN
jgi:hypothetical protein